MVWSFMASPPTGPQTAVLPGDDLPQIVPNDVCLRCDVCCRFPERESFLRPYFTAEERARAIAYGIPEDRFPNAEGGRIRLIPHPLGDGFICPCFDPVSQHCMIYAVRPLDCRLYPVSLMRDEEGRTLVMGLDLKCPYVQDQRNSARLDEYAKRIADQMTTPVRDLVVRHPDLVGPHQDDVVPVRRLGPLPSLAP